MGKTIAKIYLSNFEHNINTIKKIAPSKKICLAIKANAYGHGAVSIAKKALEIGIEFLSVATLGEAIELRNAGINSPILLLSLCSKDDIPLLVTHTVTPLVADIDFVNLLCDAVASSNVSQFPIHLKLDTGMSRHGIQAEGALELAKHVQNTPQLFIEGICTHFAVSDSNTDEDIDFTKKQIAQFNTITQMFHDNSIEVGIKHCAASGGILLHPEAHFDMIRPGILAYGYFPSMDLQEFYKNSSSVSFKPVMELISYVSALKTINTGDSVSYGRKWKATEITPIATLAVGYGDGLIRSLSEKIEVTIEGRRYPLIGRICMDQCVIKLNAIDDIKRWEEAILFGPNVNCNSAMDIANIIGTIPYEIVCLISSRVERIYIS